MTRAFDTAQMWMPKPLNTDLAGAFARLSAPRAGAFAIVPRMMASKRAFNAINARDRARRRAMVKPENCRDILTSLPTEPGDTLHAAVPGNFIFGSLITAIAQQRHTQVMHLATLSLSKRNADDLAALVTEGAVGRIVMLLSTYFEKTNTAIFEHLKHRAAEVGSITIATARTHAKVALFDFGDGHLSIETSANLRSSDNSEQLSAFADPTLYTFHRQWLDEFFT